MHPVWITTVENRDIDLGTIPLMLDDEDPRGAIEQINEGYAHGGGWNPVRGFRMSMGGSLLFPGDPLLVPLAFTILRNEIVYFYQHCWVAVAQFGDDDNIKSYEVARLD